MKRGGLRGLHDFSGNWGHFHTPPPDRQVGGLEKSSQRACKHLPHLQRLGRFVGDLRGFQGQDEIGIFNVWRNREWRLLPSAIECERTACGPCQKEKRPPYASLGISSWGIVLHQSLTGVMCLVFGVLSLVGRRSVARNAVGGEEVMALGSRVRWRDVADAVLEFAG